MPFGKSSKWMKLRKYFRTLTISTLQVDIEVNEAPVAIHMKLDDNGAAYFVEAVESDEEEQEIPPGTTL